MLIHCIKKAFSKKNIFYVLLFVSLFFAFQDISFAEVTASVPQEKGEATIKVVQGILKVLGSLLGAITALVSIFLHPGWYNGQIFNLNVYLKDIWVLMSNVVYFIFAFLLIFIAFMNIIGKEGAHHEYQLKSALPKFIVGVLIVPFTWFIVQFVLSISAILTVSVLSLPYDTFKQYDSFKSDTMMCTEYEIVLGSGKEGTESTSPTESIKCIGKKKTISEIFEVAGGKGDLKDSIYGIVSIYTYGVLGIEGFDTIKVSNIASGVKKVADITLKVVFDVVFVLAYCLLMIALFLALFTRGVWLWIYTMMSPLFGLIYFFGDPHDETLKKFKFTEFLALALVPVYVAAALSFGLLFILVASDGMKKQVENPTETGILKCPKTENPSCTIEVGDFKFTLTGSVGDVANIFGGAMGALGSLIVQMFGLVILWLAVMAALHASKITEAAAAPIHHIGESIGKTAMKMPQYAPILPGGLSPKGLDTGVGQVARSFEMNADRKGSDIATKHFGNLMGSEKQKIINDKTITLNGATDARDVTTKARDLLGSAGSVRELSLNSAALKMLAGKLEQNKEKMLKPDGYKYIDALKNATDDQAVFKALQGLEENAEHGFSLLGDSIKKDFYNTPGDMDTALASLKGNPTPTPQTNNIDFNIYRTQGDQTKFNMSEIDTLAKQLTANGMGGIYTRNELIKMFEGKGFKEAGNIVDAIKDKSIIKPDTPKTK